MMALVAPGSASRSSRGSGRRWCRAASSCGRSRAPVPARHVFAATRAGSDAPAHRGGGARRARRGRRAAGSRRCSVPPMPPIRVSAQLQPQHSDWSQMRDAWSEAEALGADCLFNWDHFYPLNGPPDGKHFEALTVLGAMAEATERVELRLARDLQQLPQPGVPRRRAPHDRPHLRRPRDPRHRRRLVREGLRRVRLRVRHGRHADHRARGGAAADRGPARPSSTRRPCATSRS